jgi:hypothetical protein
MNIVQIANDIKGYPLDLLKQYADGSNPEVPPYIALGEIERQNKMHEREAIKQQAAQGPQSSVKDQIEQKAGLMALQAQQQQQAQQQMMQQARSQPMPVPAGIPQPQAQEEVQLAVGGMAQLPIGSEFFQYGSGGIISFDGETGSDVPRAETAEEAKRREMQEIIKSAQNQQSRAGIPSALPPEAARIPGLNDTSFLEAAKQGLSVPTQNEVIAAEKARSEAFGVRGQAGEAAEAGIKKQQEAYKQATANRDYERIMAVLGGMAQGSLRGAGPAYLGQMSAERTADQAQLEKENTGLAALEKQRREEGLNRAKGIGEDITKGKEKAATIGANVYGTQTQSGTHLLAQESANRSAKDIAEIQRASAEKVAAMSNSTQIKIHELDRALREKLHSMPSPTIDSQAIDAYVAQGLSRTEAYERVKSFATGFRGEMTRDQAEDNVRKDIESGVYMKEISEAQKKAKADGVPFDMETWKRKKVETQMDTSRRPSMNRPVGVVDSNNPLLKN